MTWLVIFFGVVLAIGGALLLVRPGAFIGYLENNGDRAWFYAFAVGMRVVLGLLLIRFADVSRYPLVVEVLGWAILAAALFLAALGRKRFVRLMKWVMGWLRPVAPLAGVVAIAFGGLLVHAFTR